VPTHFSFSILIHSLHIAPRELSERDENRCATATRGEQECLRAELGLSPSSNAAIIEEARVRLRLLHSFAHLTFVRVPKLINDNGVTLSLSLSLSLCLSLSLSPSLSVCHSCLVLSSLSSCRSDVQFKSLSSYLTTYGAT
jgi:hypothetical protein